MKKIIIWGDGILAGPSGFAELLADHIFLHHPRADVSLSPHGLLTASWQDVLKEAPLRVIGKAWDLAVLGFGYTDIAAGKSPEEIAQMASAAITLILQKTQSRICLLTVVSAFFATDAEREGAATLNRLLRELAGPRVDLVDPEGRVAWYFGEHAQSPGDKRALHLDSARLTTLGRLFMAHHAYHLIPWPDFNAPVPF
jgi:hypothetical protein